MDKNSSKQTTLNLPTSTTYVLKVDGKYVTETQLGWDYSDSVKDAWHFNDIEEMSTEILMYMEPDWDIKVYEFTEIISIKEIDTNELFKI